MIKFLKANNFYSKLILIVNRKEVQVKSVLLKVGKGFINHVYNLLKNLKHDFSYN